MDLNQLYFDHQILLMRAEGAPTPERYLARQREAALVASRIRNVQRSLGAAAAQAWTALVDASALPASARSISRCGA